MSCAIKVARVIEKAATNLRLDRCRRASNAHYLRTRVLQAHLAGNQTNNGARQQHVVADPDPTNEREYVKLKNRFGVIRRDARKVT